MAITRVQSQTGNTGAAGAASLTLTFGTNLTVGNTIVVAVGSAGPGFYVTSPAGTPVSIPRTSATNTVVGSIIYLRVITAGQNAITINYPITNVNASAAGAEYSSTVGYLRIDQAISASATSTAPASGTTGTTASATELVVGCVTTRNNNAGTSIFSSPVITGTGGSAAIVGQDNTSQSGAGVDRATALLERLVTSTGTTSIAATSSQNATWIAIAATFEETPTAGGGHSFTFGG